MGAGRMQDGREGGNGRASPANQGVTMKQFKGFYLEAMA